MAVNVLMSARLHHAGEKPKKGGSDLGVRWVEDLGFLLCPWAGGVVFSVVHVHLPLFLIIAVALVYS